MKIFCKSATQVPGHGIVTKGETIEWPDGKPFPPQVIGNFVEAGTGATLCNKEPQPPTPPPANETGDKPTPPPANETGDKPDGEAVGTRQPTLEEAAAEQARAEKIAQDELLKRTAALGKEKLTAALDACGAAYKAKDTCEELAKKLLRAQGQDID
jgi:hypothetical protein